MIIRQNYFEKLLTRGTDMFRFLKTDKTKQQDQLNASHLDYIHTSIKPSTDISDVVMTRVETELKDDIDDMRQEFRHMVEKIKNRYNQ